ncbi:hypothetical protein [Halapricum hydrolyticum]|uniref:C2H2-type domain-containing protein n=1 Tax=Halapricum hydrolyticum TaxID=2979991 RepID=A0AAE3LDU0_9EURY|nr:hypothetical protein [Halapricum hydrolyticum]MCU4716888.1 hypothetical protein [Halapricum hydrolyticum]MCU4725507.1 hypothetical protein [Halapricum hydrolyticum]
MGKTVYVSTNATNRHIYHTDEDCRMLNQAANYAARDLDDLPDHQQCSHCAGEWDPYQDHESTTCEYCGRTFETQNGVYRHILMEHRDVVERALGNDPTASTGPRRAIADD